MYISDVIVTVVCLLFLFNIKTQTWRNYTTKNVVFITNNIKNKTENNLHVTNCDKCNIYVYGFAYKNKSREWCINARIGL